MENIYKKLEQLIKEYKTADTQTKLEKAITKIDNLEEPLRGYCIDFINEQDWVLGYDNQYVQIFTCATCSIIKTKKGGFDIFPKNPFSLNK